MKQKPIRSLTMKNLKSKKIDPDLMDKLLSIKNCIRLNATQSKGTSFSFITKENILVIFKIYQ